jgi:competence protein ComEC
MKNRGFILFVVFVAVVLAVLVLVRYVVAPLVQDRLPLSDRDLPETGLPDSEDPDSLLPGIESFYRVHFIDVGQGDAILVQAAGQNILVDGGERNTGLVAYLLGQAIDTLNLVVSTHPHADHIGGLPEVLDRFTVLEIIDPGVVHTTRLFTHYLELIDSLDIPFTIGRAGMRRELDSLSYYEILHPREPSDRHLNDASVVMWLVLNKVRVMLTGDIERRSEAEMLIHYPSLESNVLKVAHHASRTSSSPSFLEAVSPEVAVIFCGHDNHYGFPHQETMQQLASMQTLVFRTDLSGTVVMHTDGQDYYFETEADGAVFLGDKGFGTISQIDINTASLEELTLIIHIGPARAGHIITNRPFSSLDELITIPGIDSRRLEDIRQQNLAFVNQPDI